MSKSFKFRWTYVAHYQTHPDLSRIFEIDTQSSIAFQRHWRNSLMDVFEILFIIVMYVLNINFLLWNTLPYLP